MSTKNSIFPHTALRALLLCSLFSLCGLFSPLTQQAYAQGVAQGMSYVRIVHASPDIGTADIFVEGTTLLTNFAFATATNYVQVPPGTHKVQVALIGRGPNASVISQDLTVEPGIAYTVAALGTNATGFSLLVFKDDNTIATGMSKVRVYHLSPGTGAASVTAGNNTIVSNLAYEQASDYRSIPTGSYTFNVSIAQTSTTLSASATLPANTVTSIFAVGLLNGTPKIRLITSQAQGVPGMPGTGSDPNSQNAPHTPVSEPLPIPSWSLAIALLLCALVGMVGLTWQRKRFFSRK